MPLSRMKRLAPSLRNAKGFVEVELSFGMDELGTHFIRGRFGSALEVTCQRCLETVTLPLQGVISLGVVRSEAEGERLPGHYEPLVVNSGTVLLPALIEDELMLALPIVPLHALGQCRAEASEAVARTIGVEDSQGAAKASPFAVLDVLKKDK